MAPGTPIVATVTFGFGRWLRLSLIGCDAGSAVLRLARAGLVACAAVWARDGFLAAAPGAGTAAGAPAAGVADPRGGGAACPATESAR